MHTRVGAAVRGRVGNIAKAGRLSAQHTYLAAFHSTLTQHTLSTQSRVDGRGCRHSHWKGPTFYMLAKDALVLTRPKMG